VFLGIYLVHEQIVRSLGERGREIDKNIHSIFDDNNNPHTSTAGQIHDHIEHADLPDQKPVTIPGGRTSYRYDDGAVCG